MPRGVPDEWIGKKVLDLEVAAEVHLFIIILVQFQLFYARLALLLRHLVHSGELEGFHSIRLVFNSYRWHAHPA